MPISSFIGLETSLRGLLAQQMALNVTSNNIAGADQAGYTRQQVNMASAPTLNLPSGQLQNNGGIQLGQGTDVQSIQRMRDQFTDLQYRAAQLGLGQQDATAGALSQVEDTLQEPGDNGINALMSKFWSSWQTLANQPESPGVKSALIGNAKTLAAALNTLDTQLQSISAQASAQYSQILGSGGPVALAASSISSLNAQIEQAVSAGTQPNALLDQRDQALDTLSSLGQVSVTTLANGGISVAFGGAATPLVNDQVVTMPGALASPGGQLGALQTLSQAGGTIATYRAQLDGFANQLAGDVNTAYGSAFFTGSTAATLAVNVSAAALDAGSTAAPGANDLALAVAGLQGGAADGDYQQLVATIGSDAATANRQQTIAQAAVASADNRRQSVNGVSMDEEMTNLVRFQRGYQASARAMTTMDQLLDTLVNRTGSVGL
jgi:flagellar hook-associated protein 1 FlgK